ncbi:MAG: septum site-determining protein MinD [Eubacterium sp.]|jgi:septum site-determining protein MinD
MSTCFLVSSGKGGTGKTMFSVNLGATLAKAGKSVVIIDYDMGLRNLDLYFGLEDNVVFDVYDVMTGLCTIKQALLRDRDIDGLYLLAASPERSDGTITPLHMQVLCNKLKDRFEYVIVDAPSGIDDGLVTASAGADAAIIITTPEYSALRDADNLDRELEALGIEKRYLIINNVDVDIMAEGFCPTLKEITSMINCELKGIILTDRNIRISTNLGVPVVTKEETYIAENFRRIAKRLTTDEDTEASEDTIKSEKLAESEKEAGLEAKNEAGIAAHIEENAQEVSTSGPTEQDSQKTNQNTDSLERS